MLNTVILCSQHSKR